MTVLAVGSWERSTAASCDAVHAVHLVLDEGQRVAARSASRSTRSGRAPPRRWSPGRRRSPRCGGCGRAPCGSRRWGRRRGRAGRRGRRGPARPGAGCHGPAAASRGTSVPTPSSLSRSMEPPCRSHEVRDDGQAEPGAAELPGGGLVELGEGLEQPGLLARRDADAGVDDLEGDLVRRHPGPAVARIATEPSGGELHRVGGKVEQDLAEPDGIAPPDGDETRLAVGDRARCPSGGRRRRR